jgi:serine/threonine protein phosphatase PrpC
MRPSVGAKSDVGKVRDGNEDSYLLKEPYFAVADGMGGHLAGDVASRIAVQTISENLSDGVTGPEELERAVKNANSAIYEKASSDPSLHGMGTTCTLALVADPEIHIAHVGDSRAYLLRDDELSLITEDHTLVGRMVKEGRLQPEEAERHPQRSIITRALGVDAEVEVDLITIPVKEGDRILLCSDGLTSMIQADAIHEILTGNEDPQGAVEDLIDAANAAGGEDNITAVLLAFDGKGGGVATHIPGEELTGEVRSVEPVRRREDTQPGASRDEATGAFDIPKKRARAPKDERRSHPILVTVLLIVLVLVAAAAAFKFLIVDNSYYVAATDDGRVGIFKGLPDEVLGMTFQEVVETSQVRVEDLPDFLMEDVEDAIESDSLDDARATVANLEERAQDEEFDRSGDQKDDAKGDGSG